MRLVLVALLAEIGYAVLNISTMPVYLRFDRHMGEGLITLVLDAYLLSEAVFKTYTGHLSDRYGPKVLMAVGPAMSVISALLSFLVPHTGGDVVEVLSFIGLRAIDGLGAAMLWPAAYASVGSAVPDNRRQEAMSILNLCYMLGIALALPLGGIVNTSTGTTWASMLLAAGLFAAVSLTVWLGIPSYKATASDSVSVEAGFKEFIQCFKKIPGYLNLAIVIFVGIGFPLGIIKLFALDQFRMNEASFGALVFPAAITMAVCSVPLAKLGERIGKAKSVHIGLGLCSAGLVLISLGAFLPFFRSPSMLALGSIPVGIGFLLAVPAWMTSVSDLDSSKRATYLGSVMTAQGIGAIIGNPIGGFLYRDLQSTGVYLGLGKAFGRYMPFVGCCVCVTAGWIMSLRILREHHNPLNDGQNQISGGAEPSTVPQKTSEP